MPQLFTISHPTVIVTFIRSNVLKELLDNLDVTGRDVFKCLLHPDHIRAMATLTSHSKVLLRLLRVRVSGLRHRPPYYQTCLW